ncbi:MAG: 16S rRNA (uracil(1498)-N(3))-methyltransferase [Bacteroidota bacterium]|nr:16S rRNA (uracil(1498)-N(3))-methyltransferase [Bacteroidota bacterium]
MEVYYASPERISAENAVLPVPETRHLTRVVRLQAGDRLLIADGLGTMYIARLRIVVEGEAHCALEEKIVGMNEPKRPQVLVQALLKNPGRMDWIVEKAVELGVTSIFPVTTERTIAGKARATRWRELACAAMKQSRRCLIPRIEPLRSFGEALRALRDHTMLLFHESAETEIRAVLPAGDGMPFPGPVACLVGPEGGFTAGEVEAAVAAGAHVLSLGPRRLRSETAAVAALSYVCV